MLLPIFIIRINDRLEKEPDSVREEYAGSRGLENEVRQIVRVFNLASQVNAAELWDIKFKICPDIGLEIRIDPTLLQICDCILAVGIQLDESTNWVGDVHLAYAHILFSLRQNG